MYEQKDICKYCLSTNDDSENVLVFPCKCKTPVHIDCFVKWYNTGKKKDKCEICSDTFSRLNEKHYKSGGFYTPDCLEIRLFFPFDDIYPTPLISSNTGLRKSFSIEEKIRAAFCYLQCSRMKDLLENKAGTDSDYSFFNESYWNYDLQCFKLGCMPSNYCEKNNQQAYDKMKVILQYHGLWK